LIKQKEGFFRKDGQKKEQIKGNENGETPFKIEEKVINNESVNNKRRFSEILKEKSSDQDEEEFVLEDLYMKIAEEIMKDHISNIKNESVIKSKKELPSNRECSRLISKKLMDILNYPGRSRNDQIKELVNGEVTSALEDSEELKKKKPGKWKNCSLFHKNLFNKNKKMLKLPDKESDLKCYYSSKLSKCFNQGKNLWLLKVSQYNRGFGIELFTNLKTFENHLSNFKTGYQENLSQIKSKIPKKEIIYKSAIEIKKEISKPGIDNKYRRKPLIKSHLEIKERSNGKWIADLIPSNQTI
jgi:hypothetical protein